MARWCWVNFQCRGVLLTLITVGKGPIALAVGAGGGCLDIFSLVYHLLFPSPSLWETARYRLKYCPKGPLNPKQPTNQPCSTQLSMKFFLLINVEMPTIVGISTFMSRKNNILGLSEPEKCLLFCYFFILMSIFKNSKLS